jgi:hypothetical protein
MNVDEEYLVRLLGLKNVSDIANAFGKSRQAISQRPYGKKGKIIQTPQEVRQLIQHALEQDKLQQPMDEIVDFVRAKFFANFAMDNSGAKVVYSFQGIKNVVNPLALERTQKVIIIIPDAYDAVGRCYTHLKTLQSSLQSTDIETQILTVGETSAQSLAKTFKDSANPVTIFYMPDDYTIPIELVITTSYKDTIWQMWDDGKFYDLTSAYVQANTTINFYRALIDSEIDTRMNATAFKQAYC